MTHDTREIILSTEMNHRIDRHERSVESTKHNRWKHRFPKQGVDVRVDAFEANGKSENTAG